MYILKSFSCFSFPLKAIRLPKHRSDHLFFTTRTLAMASEAPMPVIGILSIGEMGLGVAKLLRANDYVVSTCIAGRRQE